MMTIYSKNLVDNAVLSPSTENSLFPVENIQDPRRTKVFRSTASTTSVVFDFGETSEIDTLLLVDHPSNGFGITAVTIEANNANTWGAPAYTNSTMVLSMEHGVGLLELVAAISYRFVRLTLTSSLSYCELSKIFIGKRTTLSRGINYGWTFKEEDLSLVKENRYGQRFSDIIGYQRVISASMANLNREDVEEVIKIIETRGKVKPFFIKIGDENVLTEEDRLVSMVYLTNIPAVTHRRFNNFTLSFQFEEAK